MQNIFFHSIMEETAWTSPCSFFGKVYQKCFVIVSFLGLKENARLWDACGICLAHESQDHESRDGIGN